MPNNAARLAGLSLAAILGSAAAAGAQTCPLLQSATAQHLATYLAEKYTLPTGAKLTLGANTLLAGSCVRQLTFSAAWPAISITVLLSPDQRYAFPGAFDLNQPPSRTPPPPSLSAAGPSAPAPPLTAAQLAEITGGGAAATGPPGAAVTIVEFSDFECPFCQRLAQTLRTDISSVDGANVRLVFHHFPLPQHPWAEAAAEAAECARLQSPTAFWTLHDFLFAHQSELNPGNLQSEVDGALADNHAVDPARLHACMESHATRDRVSADIALGRKYGVHATPTFFVNGARMSGAIPAAQLEQIIAQKKSAVPASAKGGKP